MHALVHAHLHVHTFGGQSSTFNILPHQYPNSVFYMVAWPRAYQIGYSLLSAEPQGPFCLYLSSSVISTYKLT